MSLYILIICRTQPFIFILLCVFISVFCIYAIVCFFSLFRSSSTQHSVAWYGAVAYILLSCPTQQCAYSPYSSRHSFVRYTDENDACIYICSPLDATIRATNTTFVHIFPCRQSVYAHSFTILCGTFLRCVRNSNGWI